MAAGVVVLGTTACGVGSAPAETARGAEAFFLGIPAELAARGPLAWLDLFEDGPAFFMASDGAVAFDDRAAAETFLADFAPTVSGMSLEWIDPRLDPLTASIVAVSSSYAETITLTDGTATRFGGHVSGILRRSGAEWSIQHLHWSSPAATEGG